MGFVCLRFGNRRQALGRIAVLAECDGDQVYPITLVLGKALEMVAPSGAPVFAVVTGWKVSSAVENLRYYGADRIYVYDDACSAL